MKWTLIISMLLPVAVSAQIDRGFAFAGNTATIQYNYQVRDLTGKLTVDVVILKDQRTGEAWVRDGNTGMYLDKRYFKRYWRKLLKRTK